jgi:hypothetical protein
MGQKFAKEKKELQDEFSVILEKEKSILNSVKKKLNEKKEIEDNYIIKLSLTESDLSDEIKKTEFLETENNRLFQYIEKLKETNTELLKQSEIEHPTYLQFKIDIEKISLENRNLKLLNDNLTDENKRLLQENDLLISYNKNKNTL